MATLARPLMETSSFFQHLARTRRSVLILDFETTLGRLRQAKSRLPYPSVDELLDCIAMMTVTRIIVASSLPSAELGRHRLPNGAEIWGGRARRVRLDELAFGAPAAWLTGEPHTVTPVSGRTRLWVRPVYHLGGIRPVLAPVEELGQFLLDWLRACAGEVC